MCDRCRTSILRRIAVAAGLHQSPPDVRLPHANAVTGRNIHGFALAVDCALHRIIDARPHRVLCVLVGVWMLNAFDLVLTVMAHEQGFLVELNPLACVLLEMGAAWVVAFKVTLVVAGSYPMLWFRSAPVAEVGAFIAFACYTALATRWFECYELYEIVAGM